MRSARSYVRVILCAPERSLGDVQGDLLPRTFRRRETETVIGRIDIPCGQAQSDWPSCIGPLVIATGSAHC